MSMQIKGSENIATIFSIFHDAGINSYAINNSNLEIQIGIQYLAERIDPSFRIFKVTLCNAKKLILETWPDDHDAKPDLITGLNSIFQGDLEILGGENKGESIQINLNQSKPGIGYCGGVLKLQASSAIVSDQAGKNYPLRELGTLANEYWQEWKLKNKT